MATEAAVLHATSHPRLSAEDFETASIRSAAPSYVSEAPSYHTLPPSEAVPAYTPRATSTTTTAGQRPAATSRQPSSMIPPIVEPRSTFSPGAGLPPIPRRSDISSAPSLSQFHIPPWSSISSGNPQVRHYQSVANRRVAAASASPYTARPLSSSSTTVEGALRAAIGRIQANANANAYSSAASSEEDDDGRLRPLEDPDLVGEEAAAHARRERLARKHGEDVLILEDRRWDFWLSQMRDVGQREQSWNAFRANMENRSSRRTLMRRFGRQ